MQNLNIVSRPMENTGLNVKNPVKTNSYQKISATKDFKAFLSEMTQIQKNSDTPAEKPEAVTASVKPATEKPATEKSDNANAKVKSSAEKKFSVKENVSSVSEKDVSEKTAEDIAVVNESSVYPAMLQNLTDSAAELTVQLNDSSITAEEGIAITSSQMEFLRKSDKSDDLDFMIENAVEYSSEDKSTLILNNMQNFSVDKPEEFLAMAEHISENVLASDLTEESLKPFSENFADDTEEDKSFFKSEVKSVSKNAESLFSVTDLRTDDEKVEALKETEGLKVEVSEKDNSTVEMTLNLKQDFQSNITASDSQSAAAEGSTFQQMLSQSIQENAPEFVKAGNIVLKDNHSGSINMILKPESLGNVKVSLQLSDKVITGQIVVATKEAFEAFKENLDTLKQAFQQNGFENAEFNLSFSDNSQSGAFAQQQDNRQQMNQFISDKVYSQFVTAEVDSSVPEKSYFASSDSKIDVVA